MDKQYRLPKEFAEKWLEELRSGKYQQGIGTLVNELKVIDNKLEADKFCCLGVAGRICGVSVDLMADLNTLGSLDRSIIYRWMVPGELINVFEGSLAIKLMRMNDGYSGEGNPSKAVKRHSFEEIADWVENNVEFY